jgi:hypothetical protein
MRISPIPYDCRGLPQQSPIALRGAHFEIEYGPEDNRTSEQMAIAVGDNYGRWAQGHFKVNARFNTRSTEEFPVESGIRCYAVRDETGEVALRVIHSNKAPSIVSVVQGRNMALRDFAKFQESLTAEELTANRKGSREEAIRSAGKTYVELIKAGLI